VDTGIGNGWHEPRREPGPNPGAAQFQDHGETGSHVEEMDRKHRENGFTTTG